MTILRIRKPNNGWKAAAKRVKQRIEALQSVLAKVNKRIDQLAGPAGNPARTKIAALEKALADKRAADKDFEEQIKLLKSEISKLPKALVKMAKR